METNKDDKNLDALFSETLNQFNYSSSLYDNLDQKINSYLFLGSIILAVSFGSHFLGFLYCMILLIKVIYWSGVALILISIYMLFSLRGIEFKRLDILSIKDFIIKYPKKDVRKNMISRYIPIIEENFTHYKEKNRKLRKAFGVMKIGGAIFISAIIYILVFVYFIKI